MYACINVCVPLSDLKMFIEGERMIKNIISWILRDSQVQLIVCVCVNLPVHGNVHYLPPVLRGKNILPLYIYSHEMYSSQCPNYVCCQ